MRRRMERRVPRAAAWVALVLIIFPVLTLTWCSSSSVSLSSVSEEILPHVNLPLCINHKFL